MPLGTQEELPWGNNANCYAYASDCQNPANGAMGGAVPGVQATANGVVVAAHHTNEQRVLLDGGANITLAGNNPHAIPMVVAGHYLICLLEGAHGFHFIRRDSYTGRWSWKDGNGGTVKYNALHVPTNHFVYINDGNFVDLVVTNPNNYAPWAYANMNFVAFFQVANAGFLVRR